MLEQCGSYLVGKNEVLVEMLDHGGVALVSLGPLMTASDNDGFEKVNGSIGRLVGLVVSFSVEGSGSPFVHHVLGGMANDLCDGDGSDALIMCKSKNRLSTCRHLAEVSMVDGALAVGR